MWGNAPATIADSSRSSLATCARNELLAARSPARRMSAAEAGGDA
jgi:hypothetical protein